METTHLSPDDSSPNNGPPDLEEILAEYLEQIDAGREVDESEWIERFPTLREELAEFFRDHRVVKTAVEQSSAGRTTPGSSNGARPSEFHSAPPTHIGGYELIREIGRGGMGVVYEAHQPDLSRNVALKMLLRSCPSSDGGSESEEDLARLRNEAESIARLDHPAIVSVHDMGSDRGQFWFTMQLVRGKNLAHYDTRFRSEPLGAVRIVEQITTAIAHAHRRGVLHRDLKPGNILLDEEDRPHVSDFGLARRVDFDSSLTQTGSILGTPSYLAPEQLVDPRGVTTAADVYGLGAILFFLLTGRPPIVADSIFAAVDQIRNAEIPPPSRFNAAVSKDLDAVCGRCLEKRPEDRYRTADELAVDLRRLAEGKPVEARAIGVWGRLNRWRRRNPGLAWLTASVVGLSVLLMIGSTAAAVLLAAANRQSQESLGQAIAAKGELETEKQTALRNLYEAHKLQARAARYSGRPGQRVDSIRAAQEAAEFIGQIEVPDSERLALRNEQIAATQLVDLVEDRPRTVGLSDRDARLAIRTEADYRSITISDAPSSRVLGRAVVQGAGRIDHLASHHFRITTDGKYLVARVAHGAKKCSQVWEVGREEPFLVTQLESPPRSPHVAQHALSPNNRRVGFVTGGRLKIHRLSDGEQILDKPAPGKVSVCFSHKSNQVALYGDKDFQILDADTGEELRRIETPIPVEKAAWSPEDSLLAGVLYYAYSESKNLHLWDVRTGDHRELTGHMRKVADFDFHPRHNLLATSAWDGSARLWSVSDGRQLMRLDGAIFGFNRSGGELGVRGPVGAAQWRLERPGEFYELATPTRLNADGAAISKQMRGVAIHPDGRLMLGGSLEGVHAWDLATQECIASSARGACESRFSPDGRSLFTIGKKHDEYYVSSVARQESDDEIVFSIGAPRRLTLSPLMPGAATPESLADLGVAVEPKSPLFGVRWFDDQAPGEFFVYDMQQQRLIRVQAERRRQNYPAVSPDGRLLAIGHYHGPDTHVWDVATGKLVKMIPSSRAQVAFSPDGRLLAVNEAGRCSVYGVGAWRRLHQSAAKIHGTSAPCVAFSPDSSMLAYTPGYRSEIILLSTHDFQELATLRLPSSGQMVARIDFSPDSSQLVESVGQVSYLWDLRRIRERLGDLDWRLPAFAEAAHDSSKRLRVEFEASSLVDKTRLRLDELSLVTQQNYARILSAVNEHLQELSQAANATDEGDPESKDD